MNRNFAELPQWTLAMLLPTAWAWFTTAGQMSFLRSLRSM